ncbi:MAG: hypothetical protein KAJ78_02910 [Acidobacteria bacterium]|nr:hypothetical protein [Acidobacteriota bacterium]
MHWTYSCPRCQGTLNPEEAVILIAEHAGKRVLIGLHPEPGIYEIHPPPEIDIKPGSRWLLMCPLCNADLRSDLSEDLAHLDMNCGGDLHRVYFSRVAGEQATFVVSAEGLLHDHGIHTDQYVEDLLHQSFK